jgi:hypothetical protein
MAFKTNNMKPTSTQQEILLLTGTNFSARHSFEKDDKDKMFLTEKEQLEEACWNGLLKDMLPEICEQVYGNKLYMWQVWKTNSFIEIELGEIPEEKEKYYSIDPYSFLPEYFLS